MSIKTKVQKASIIASNPDILFGKKNYLFIVSHMRSRSTVLCHILGNHSKICGYKELHMSYKDKKSLINMQIALVKDLKCKIAGKYLLDKILHNTAISDYILTSVQPKILFLLREPNDTIKSIINMGIKTEGEKYKNPLNAVEYYCNRLNQLEKLSLRLKGEYLFVESNDLVENTDETFKKITDWLELEEPLNKTYTTFKDTGVFGAGDPLENIKSGLLMTTKGYPEITLPDDLLYKASEAYIKCRNILADTHSKN